MRRAGDYRGGGYRSNVYRDRARERAPRQSGSAKGPKALLFVQSGNEQPKCRGQVSEFNRYNDVPDHNGALGDAPYFLTPLQSQDRMAAERWWLVECENAAHGRGIIALADHIDSLFGFKFTAAPCGRILAHGSRAPREAGTINEGGGSDAE